MKGESEIFEGKEDVEVCKKVNGASLRVIRFCGLQIDCYVLPVNKKKHNFPVCQLPFRYGGQMIAGYSWSRKSLLKLMAEFQRAKVITICDNLLYAHNCIHLLIHRVLLTVFTYL